MIKMKTALLGFLFAILAVNQVFAQDSIRNKKTKVISKMAKASADLEKSLDENDDAKIAKNYERLAEEFKAKGDNAKAEEYFAKALSIYKKIDAKADKPRVARSLAKSQESQNKYDDAIKNYEGASLYIKENKSVEKINTNDANRLRNVASPSIQADYVNSNIDLLKKESKTEEVAEAYVQKAENDLQQNNTEIAIQSYNKAIVYSANKPKEVIKIKNKIANVYVANNQFDEALAINQKLLTDAASKKDIDTQIAQLQELATIYFKKEEPKKAVELLQNAYKISNENGKTNEVKKTLSKLISYYKINKNDAASIALYDDFFERFDTLIKNDLSLIDAKTFEVNEGKIAQLEKEKILKDELISKSTLFNYYLIGALLLLSILIGFIAKSLYEIKTKNKEIALQSLRREMNPHFIFNSLNSVNQFISQNKELEANKYLTNYSNLMRSMMENSNKDFVSLSSEVEQLQKYLNLEHLRFQDKFDFVISVDEKIDAETTFIPNMIIQPHLENAIWHGLRYLENKGLLQLNFYLKNNKIIATINDNGIGLSKSQELKTHNQKAHESRGLSNTKERISLLNDLYKKEISFEIKEKMAPETGTIVEIICPLLHKID
jgi:two-component system, sensor histidine kinase YesM